MIKKTSAALLFAAISCTTVLSFAFTDVNNSNPDMYNGIEELSALDILNGYDDGTFRPENPITRAEMAKIASRLLPKTIDPGVTVLYDASYGDIDKNYWAWSDINKLTALGYLSGYEDNTYRPENPVTYQEMLKIIVTMMHYEEAADKSGGYPVGYIQAAEKLLLTSENEFDFSESSTRGQAALIISRALDTPHQTMISYDVEMGASFVPDSNITFRKMIEGSKANGGNK